MQEHLDFIIDDAPPETAGGIRIPWTVVVSIVFHGIILTWLFLYKPKQVVAVQPAEQLHFVELMRQPAKDFNQAPGPKVDKTPLNAPLSDANRKASMPKPTGDQPTLRPGDGSSLFVPSPPPGDRRRPQQATPNIQQPPSPQTPQSSQAAAQQAANATQELMRESTPGAAMQQPAAGASPNQPSRTPANTPPMSLRQAIREVGKVASLGRGDQGPDLGSPGGDKGYAAEGPVSFETQWYDWGEYAEGMVNRIRVNWYTNMPMPLLQTGLKGVVTIRFTIHRDGHISDIQILSSSGIPPYDFAAKKAIELASPLNPLPKDFPEETERVTCMFFYNQEPPKR